MTEVGSALMVFGLAQPLIQSVVSSSPIKRLVESVVSFQSDAYVVTFNSEGNKQAFDMILEFLSDQPYFREKCNNVTPQRSDVVNSSRLSLVPAPGFHEFDFQGARVKFHREAKETKGVVEKEVLTLYVKKTEKENLKNLIREAENNFRKSDKLKVWGSDYNGWYLMGYRDKVPLSSFTFPPRVSNIASEIQNFLSDNTRDFLKSRGTPWRKGYLLHGPPGCGKSSFIHAVASDLGLDIYYLNLSSLNQENVLIKLVGSVPPKSLLVVEDIEAQAFLDAKHPLSGLLNSLDGIPAGEGRVLFMTSNDPELIDTRLKRPGRIDRTVTFPGVDCPLAWRMLKTFYDVPQEPIPYFQTGFDQITAKYASISSAAVKQALIQSRTRPQDQNVYEAFFTALNALCAQQTVTVDFSVVVMQLNHPLASLLAFLRPLAAHPDQALPLVSIQANRNWEELKETLKILVSHRVVEVREHANGSRVVFASASMGASFLRFADLFAQEQQQQEQ